ncbi:helix-turn-helix domain-containing protein [Acidobacteria bacterium AH-259-G07]|nr:helix-turn-helix domain-containing protein [Acidobacteria bacterium AH-259-G07]
MVANLKERFLTAEQAAEITGLHPSTLRKLAWQRRIRSFKVLGCLRFKREDLERLIVERPATEEVGK